MTMKMHIRTDDGVAAAGQVTAAFTYTNITSEKLQSGVENARFSVGKLVQ